MPKAEIKGSVVIPTTFESKNDTGLIVGYASTPLVDLGDEKYRDRIPADLWLKALQSFFLTGAEINFMHRNILAGKTVKVELDSNGPLLYTRPLKKYIPMMIEEGDLTGFSIEYSLYDYDFEDNPDPFDSRPIRVFKEFDVWRVSYVDIPMNQGSLFVEEKMKFDDFEYSFDLENGKVIVTAGGDQAFAELADLFSSGLDFSPEEKASTGKLLQIDIKRAKEDIPPKEHRPTNPFQKAIDTLAQLGGKTQEGTVKDKELKEQLTELTEKVSAVSEKFEALDLDAEQLASLEEKVDALIDAVPVEDEETETKSLAERLEALEAGVKGSTLATDVAVLEATVGSIVDLLEKEQGKSTVQRPLNKGAERDFWAGQ